MADAHTTPDTKKARGAPPLRERPETADLAQLRWLHFALDHAPVAAFLIGPDLKLHYVNETACRFLGYDREEMLALSLDELAPRSTRERQLEAWEEAVANGVSTFESAHRAKDGRLIPMEVSISRFAFAGRGYACVVARDISKRKQAEEDLRRGEEARQRLEAQIQHAQKLESLGVLAGGIAHDFNNLLMAVLGNADLALSELPRGSPVRDYLEDIETASRRAAELCRQMLAYSGKGRFVVEPLDLNAVVDEMAHMLEVAISKKVILGYDFAEPLPLIEADATQVRQVIMNLITNASEAIGDRTGYVTIRTGATECDGVYLRNTYVDDRLGEGVYAYVEVTDTGCGMDDETLSRVFDPFFSTKMTGRGLGMAAVLGIVRGHNGAIKVTSRPGEGCTFRVLFPSSSKERPLELDDGGDLTEGWVGTGTVLLIDDEETVRALGRKMLERLGFEVLTAGDGVEGLELFRHHPEGVVCVLLDLTMPHMDGEACFHELRRIRADLPVILSSGYDEQQVTSRFVGQNLAGFVQKPYRLATLRDAMQAVLGNIEPQGGVESPSPSGRGTG